MAWKGYKYLVEDLYENIDVSQTVDMREDWIKGHEPDKRNVETKCPICGDITHPLLVPMTVELAHKRTKKVDNTIYDLKCKKCKKRYKFKLICNVFHYPKLGEY